MPAEKNYWFPAKRFGWGWGFPSKWQGRVVLAGFIVLLVAGSFVVRPDRQLGGYLAWVFVTAMVFFAVVKAKGEPPRWRWGKGPES